MRALPAASAIAAAAEDPRADALAAPRAPVAPKNAATPPPRQPIVIARYAQPRRPDSLPVSSKMSHMTEPHATPRTTPDSTTAMRDIGAREGCGLAEGLLTTPRA